VFSNLISVPRSALYYADDNFGCSIDAGTSTAGDIERWRADYHRIVELLSQLAELVDGDVRPWSECSAFEDHHEEMRSALPSTFGISAFDNLRNYAESLSLRNYSFFKK
jgi:hypothetical protein